MDLQGDRGQKPYLPLLDLSTVHHFAKPIKRIHEGQDLSQFQTSLAYRDIGKFILQLNRSMCPRKVTVKDTVKVQTWEFDSPDVPIPDSVQHIKSLLKKIDKIIEEAPPDTGPRRFGNVSFRKWFALLKSRVLDLLRESLTDDILSLGSSDEVSALDEISEYLLGSFGSEQRLDYGTGHELSFLAFLGCLWKLGWFKSNTETSENGALERSIVLGIIEPYLEVVRHLILVYTLEPAGSHGVWGLDDHFFLPYIFGSAEYCPAITDDESTPVEGSLPSAPKSGDVTKQNIVDRERKHNMYFSAVGFIYDVKTGPFWEHSPILFDISGVRSGWGKINKGMIKMYNAEVLSKFPVVQHFPFGSLFSWEKDPSATSVPTTIHTTSQPTAHPMTVSGVAGNRPLPQDSTRAPWATQQPGMSTTAVGGSRSHGPMAQQGGMAHPQAPWANTRVPQAIPPQESTRAPWKSKQNDTP